MAGIGRVIRLVARRRGAEAVTRAGRPRPVVRVFGGLAQDLANALTQEGHRLAPVAREVAREAAIRDREAIERAQG
jgi:hypothetical protein